MPSPAFEKDNAFTRSIVATQRLNAEGGTPAGRNFQEISLGRGPSVRTAAMNAEPVPLSAEEVEERNKMAAGIGIIKLDTNEEESGYPSLDDALAAGEPVNKPKLVVNNRPTAREFISTPSQVIKLPDFKNVQIYDLESNVVIVDGMRFTIPEGMSRELKANAIEIVLDAVVKQLAEAWSLFGIPPEYAENAVNKLRESVNGGKPEEAVQVREGSNESEQSEAQNLSV